MTVKVDFNGKEMNLPLSLNWEPTGMRNCFTTKVIGYELRLYFVFEQKREVMEPVGCCGDEYAREHEVMSSILHWYIVDSSNDNKITGSLISINSSNSVNYSNWCSVCSTIVSHEIKLVREIYSRHEECVRKISRNMVNEADEMYIHYKKVITDDVNKYYLVDEDKLRPVNCGVPVAGHALDIVWPTLYWEIPKNQVLLERLTKLCFGRCKIEQYREEEDCFCLGLFFEMPE
jgi:hypothetical protein